MRFTPIRKSEHGAIGNHTDWKIIKAVDDKVLISCICHQQDRNDLRWIHISQIEED